MDDFNNFFDDQRSPQPEHTPVYHTPSPKNNNKLNATSVICIVLAAVMCIVVLVNVIVLASMKEQIAQEYAQSMSADMKAQYQDAIDEALSGTNVIEDVTQSATEKVNKLLNTTVGEVANVKSASVARLYMAEGANSSSFEGLATGFLITDSTEDCNERYILTNAHCVRYEKKSRVSFGPWGGGSQYSYTWATYGTIICKFDSEETYYLLEAVAYGSYTGDYLSADNDQPDIALLKIVDEIEINNTSYTKKNNGNQPSNDTHPSLKIVASDNSYKKGDPVALIGNPEGFGESTSISTGCISQMNVTIDSWGAGTFILTDSAVNSGNSGGPMINIYGDVVGIVESKLVDESIDNMGFALSAQTIRDFISWANEKSGLNLNI